MFSPALQCRDPARPYQSFYLHSSPVKGKSPKGDGVYNTQKQHLPAGVRATASPHLLVHQTGGLEGDDHRRPVRSFFWRYVFAIYLEIIAYIVVAEAA